MQPRPLLPEASCAAARAQWDSAPSARGTPFPTAQLHRGALAPESTCTRPPRTAGLTSLFHLWRTSMPHLRFFPQNKCQLLHNPSMSLNVKHFCIREGFSPHHGPHIPTRYRRALPAPRRGPLPCGSKSPSENVFSLNGILTMEVSPVSTVK